MRWAILIALAIWGAALWGCGMAPAHEAPSGWQYPSSCCSDQDCYRIDESEVRPAQGGGYRLVRTGEVFREPGAPGVTPSDRTFRWSGDGEFHRCSPEGKPADATSLCLLVPRPGV